MRYILILAVIALILQVYKTYQIWYWSRLTTITVTDGVDYEEGDTFFSDGELLTVLSVNGSTSTVDREKIT